MSDRLKRAAEAMNAASESHVCVLPTLANTVVSEDEVPVTCACGKVFIGYEAHGDHSSEEMVLAAAKVILEPRSMKEIHSTEQMLEAQRWNPGYVTRLAELEGER